MLLVVTFIACFTGRELDRCETVEVPWEGTLMQCQLFGQQAAAGWIRQHGSFQLRGGYRCVAGRAA